MAYPYATVDNVLTGYKPLNTMLATVSSTLSISTTDIASLFVPNAQSFMDAFLAARYVVPVVVEPLITQLCSDIATYKILEDKLPRIPEFMERRYTNAVSILWMLKNGDMLLTGSNQIVSSGGDQEVWSNVLENVCGPVFRPVEAGSWCCFP
jgi:phage gp36-like protein